MKKLFTLVCLLLILGASSSLTAQNNVGIGTANPDANAILDLTSKTQGVLVPRMPAVNRLAITNPVDGLMVYDTDSSCFFFFSASTNSWTSLCQTSGGGTSVAAYNTAVTFNQANDSLGVTDAAGTISAFIPLERWQANPATDDSTNTSTLFPVFASMSGATVTFTPHTSIVYITATVSGEADTTTAAYLTGIVGVQLVDLGSNSVLIGSSTAFTSSAVALTPWNLAMTTSYSVTPGFPVTLGLSWAGIYSDLSSHKLKCLAASDPFHVSHRSIIVME